MMNKNLIFSNNELGINIYSIDKNAKIIEANNNFYAINSKASLIKLLVLFELPLDRINSCIIDSSYSIGEILPLSELVCFLVTDMRSTYWIELVFSFLLNDDVTIRLNADGINCLENKDLINWLPQNVFHLVKKVINKSLR